MRTKNLKKRIEELTLSRKELDPAYDKIKKDANDGEIRAVMLIDMIKNYNKKQGCRWDSRIFPYCTTAHRRSPKVYEFLREEVLTLPCLETLNSLTGNVSEDVRASEFVTERFCIEAQPQNLIEPQRVVPLILEETTINPIETYLLTLNVPIANSFENLT